MKLTMLWLSMVFGLLYGITDAMGQLAPSEAQYSENGNYLLNPSFEQGKTKWANGVGTYVVEAVSAAHIKNNAKITLAAQTLDFSQTILTSTVPAGVVGKEVIVSAWVKTTLAGVQLCGLSEGVEQNCFTVDTTGTWKRYYSRTVWGATSVGVKLKSTGAVTGDVALDGVRLDLKDTTENPDKYFAIDLNANPAWKEGTLFYDNTAKSLSYYNDDSDVTVNLGQESLIRVRNTSGSTILNGSVVSVNGATGQFPTVELADASASVNVIAVATHDIADNAWGYATAFGVVNGLNTSGFTEGATVYLDPENPGQFIEAVYAQESYAYKIGVVTYAHATQGKLLVDIDKQISIGETTLTNSVKLEGNDGRVITANSESIPFNGSGTGWTSGPDGSTTISGNYYTVQFEDSLVFLEGMNFYSGATTYSLNLYVNGSAYKRISDTINQANIKFSYTSKRGEFPKGSKIAIAATAVGTLSNNSDIHYLNIVETANTDAAVVEDASNLNTQLRYSGSVSLASNIINWGTPVENKGSVSTSDNSVFTINETDVYTISAVAVLPTAGNVISLLKNSSYVAPSSPNVLSWGYSQASPEYNAAFSWTGELVKGDTIRIGASVAPVSNTNKLTISKASKRNIINLPLGGDENVYSARINSDGTIASQNSTFIASINKTGTGNYQVNLVSGFFAVAPSVQTTVNGANTRIATTGAISTTGFTVYVYQADDNVAADFPFSVTVQRQGADYKPASAKAFATSSDLQYYYPVETQIGWYGAKALYARSFTLTATLSADTTIATIDTGLHIVNGVKSGADYYLISEASYSLDIASYANIGYTPSTGAVRFDVVGASLQAGHTFTIKYTKP